MRVPSKSKNARRSPGPPGLRATSSTSVSTKPLNVTESPDPVQVRTSDDWTMKRSRLGASTSRAPPEIDCFRSEPGDGVIALSGQLADGQLRLVEQLGRHVLEEPDAVALVVGLEHRGGEDVAAAVTGAGFGVDAELHGRELTPTARA